MSKILYPSFQEADTVNSSIRRSKRTIDELANKIRFTEDHDSVLILTYVQAINKAVTQHEILVKQQSDLINSSEYKNDLAAMREVNRRLFED